MYKARNAVMNEVEIDFTQTKDGKRWFKRLNNKLSQSLFLVSFDFEN